jgi:hypothetical protein
MSDEFDTVVRDGEVPLAMVSVTGTGAGDSDEVVAELRETIEEIQGRYD